MSWNTMVEFNVSIRKVINTIVNKSVF